MKIENVEVYGFRRALHGMRNPKDSWAASDSSFAHGPMLWPAQPYGDIHILTLERPLLGKDDLGLACRLIKSGTDHRKFLRQIMVWWDITICRAVWQELDTYKVATVRNSCSTMHKLGFRDLAPEDFQDGDVDGDVLACQNEMGLCYREKRPYDDGYKTYEGVDLLRHMKMRLPESFLQQATYSFSYETGLAMWRSRHDHRMREWSGPGGICDVIAHLPYMDRFIEAIS